MNSRLIYIKWLDSKGSTFVWEFKDEVEPMLPSECETVGFLIDDNKDYKTVVQTISKEQVLGRITIPSCSIVQIKELMQ